MKWTGLNELREKYLSFFESKGHLRLPSFSLIPKDDNSLLLINSGMAPMKKYFTGEVTPPRRRVTTCQKCIRTGDIENVGITDRHGTFFEMLGNFSFGDYFKHEATAWAWEFCTRALELPVEKLWVTIYRDDDEAFDIWTKEVGVDPARIVRLGKEDNFWEHGSGPCGPCSEIYFDRGEKYGCGKPTCGVGCDCDRYVEFWNVVFSQFNSDGKGHYPPMEHPNIDTGMGLERLACIMQNVDNLFLVDTVQNIMKHVCRLSGVKYGEDPKKDISLRVITDHIRGAAFMIGDGVMPSNEGRGYVLRRLLRRAARHGRLLGLRGAFLYQVADTVIHENENAYPELAEKRDMITKLIRVEEESFAKTIDQGLQLLNGYVDETLRAGRKVFPGADAFRLSDTYGFPIDLTKEIVAERGLTVDEREFDRRMREQRERARAARGNAGADAWAGENSLLDGVPETEFLGYETMQAEAKVLAVLKDGERVESATAGDDVAVVLDRTPFYGEGGGQVGDTGSLESDGAVLKVTGTTKNHAKNYLHRASVRAGTIRTGETVRAAVDEERRRAVMRNHTAAHLLQAALRKVLGTHVEQAGQLVDEKRVRFDFTHFAAMTGEELRNVERTVNRVVLSAVPVESREMPIEEAKKLGAVALFGEKYGKVVRVVSAGDFSKEFCGGTHVGNTAQIGLFKIVSESSAAAGVRRIEAVTGTNVLALLDGAQKEIAQAAEALKLNSPADLARKAGQTTAELKEKDREIESLNARLAAVRVENLLGTAKDAGGVKVVTAKVEGVEPAALRVMCDKVLERSQNCVAVIAGVNGGKANIAACAGKDARAKGAHAGKIVRQVAALAGGGGGGRPESAMAGAKDLSRLDGALAAVEKIVADMVK
ncbi:MAG: alanine--tRNA ligase [Oscillospiraceae bacterium]|jgi:alanyl-tRNA synthetase|nr:alanine--tRNA ligase [Oscillospiraceae bacterium]MCI1989987.1 alanine--tRNA ligase [Oscillospiraceae bacterium]MCI2034841.1 alanine--tRNA ligase [Oscillospiraceae bacterium]